MKVFVQWAILVHAGFEWNLVVVVGSPAACAYGQNSGILEVWNLMVFRREVRFGIETEARYSIRDLMLSTRSVNDVEVERGQPKSPTHEPVGRIVDAHEPAKRVVI